MFPVHIQRVCIGCKNPTENCADSFDGSIKARCGTMCWEKWKAQSLYESQLGERRRSMNFTGVITSAKSRDKFFGMSAVTVMRARIVE